MAILFLFLSGILVGIMSSFFGVGGGVIIMPVLYTFYPHLPTTALISISLGTIFLNTFFNNIRFKLRGDNPSSKIIALLTVSATIGGLLGAKLSYGLDQVMAKRIFGTILILMLIKTILYRPSELSKRVIEHRSLPYILTGLLGSFVSGLTGLGGGAIYAPVFLSIIKLPPHLVAPYSNIGMTTASFMGLIPHLFHPNLTTALGNTFDQFQIGHVNFLMIAILFLGTQLSSHWAIELNHKVSAQLKRKLMIAMFALLALKIIFF